MEREGGERERMERGEWRWRGGESREMMIEEKGAEKKRRGKKQERGFERVDRGEG